MKNYYDVHVNYGNSGYSLCVSSKEKLTDDEVVGKISTLNKWDEKGDSTLVDSIENISEKEAFEWYGENRIIETL